MSPQILNNYKESCWWIQSLSILRETIIHTSDLHSGAGHAFAPLRKRSIQWSEPCWYAGNCTKYKVLDFLNLNRQCFLLPYPVICRCCGWHSNCIPKESELRTRRIVDWSSIDEKILPQVMPNWNPTIAAPTMTSLISSMTELSTSNHTLADLFKLVCESLPAQT